jgi:hypothetical protein
MISDQDYELLSAYLDDALPAEARADLEARLPREAALRRELDALRATIDLIHGLPDLKAPRSFTLDASMVRRPAQRWLIFPTTTAFSALSAVAAFVLVALAVALTSFGTSAPAAPSSQVAFQSTQIVEQQEAAPQTAQQAAQPTAAISLTMDDFSAGEPLLFAAPPGTPAPDTGGDAAEAGLSVMSAAAATEDDSAAGADAAMSAPAESPTLDAMSAAAAPASTDGMSAMNAAADAPPVAGADTALEAAPAAGVERAQPSPTAPMSATPFDAAAPPEVTTVDALPDEPPFVAAAPTTPAQTATREPSPSLAAPAVPGDVLPLILLLTGGLLGALAVITTIIRRRA